MAKKKSINLDKELTISIRRGCKKAIERGVYSFNNEFDYNSVINTLELLKSEYLNHPSEYSFNLFNTEDFVELINYMIDLIISSDNVDNVLKNIKDRLVKSFGDRDIEISSLVATNRIFGKLERSYKNSILEINEILENLGVFATCLIIYVLTYTKGIKNKAFKQIKECNDILTLEYEGSKLYDINSIKDNDKMVKKCLYNIIVTCNNFYNSVYKGFEKACKWNVFHMNRDYGEYPFMSSEKDTYISLDEIRNISNNKIYLMPPGGVHFDFINKVNNVDCIELKEYSGNLLCSITIFNKGGVYVHHDKSLFESENLVANTDKISELIKTMDLCSDEKIKINFRIPLEEALNFKTIQDISGIVFPGSIFFGNKDGYLFHEVRKWIYCCLSCLYLAYCCPTRFQNYVRLYNIERNSNGKFDKKSSYRTAYMRKLPEGQIASTEAIQNARLLGFNNIPQGYTFVRASNIHYLNKDKKKIIKISD